MATTAAQPYRQPLIERIAQRPPLWARVIFYLVLVGIFMATEYAAALKLLFPFAFAMPVLLAAWWDGRQAAYPLAALSMVPWFISGAFNAGVFRAIALVTLIELVWHTVSAAKRIRLLEGLLHVCVHCHRIRTEQKLWMRLEAYIHEHSEATFSHGICPACLKKYYEPTA